MKTIKELIGSEREAQLERVLHWTIVVLVIIAAALLGLLFGLKWGVL